MRVLLVEPYFGGSHRAWAEGYRNHSAYDIELLTLPARWWKWRMRGGFVTLAERCRTLAEGGYRPDVILATDMLDLAAFRGLLPPEWSSVACALYFHESQFTYPDSPQMEPDLSYGFTNWTSALAADAVVFNSEYHHSVFLDEVPRVLRQFPDHRHEHLVDRVRGRSHVVPVGVDLSWIRPEKSLPPLVLWNHRWEHDKNPDAFLSAVLAAAERVEFLVALCGESFGNAPPEFGEVAARLGDRVVQFGHASRDRYREVLNWTDVVVSTAWQEFLGVAVIEAIAARAFPVLPDRLSYPELIPPAVHDEVLYAPGEFADALIRAVEDHRMRLRVTDVTAGAMERFAWTVVAPQLDALLAGVTRLGNTGV